MQQSTTFLTSLSINFLQVLKWGKRKLFELEPMSDQEVCEWSLGSWANTSLMERTFINARLVEVNGSVNNLLLFARDL